MATFSGDVQYSQVMGHLPTPVKSGVFGAGFIPVTWWENPQQMGGFHREFFGGSRFTRVKELVKQQ